MRCSCTAPHGLLRIERQLRDQRRPGLQAGQDAGLIAEVVEERVDAEVAVGAGDLPARRPRRGRVQRLPVRAQRALAAAGGAGGEQDVGDVVGFDRGGTGIDGIEIGARRATNSSQVPSSLSIGTRTMCRRSGRAIAIQIGGLVGAEELAGRHQQRRPGAGQHVGGLAGGVAGVQRHEHAAGVVRGQARHHPVPGIRRPDRDPVPGAYAEFEHRGGGPADLVAQLAERQPPIVGHQRVVVEELVGNPVQDLRNGPIGSLPSSMLL